MSTVSICLICITLLTLLRHFIWKHKPGLPPGPKGWPIVGNLFNMPTETIWETFGRWGEIYGEISSVTVFGQTTVIINSLDVAHELLNKKGQIYSDRPEIPMGGELIGWKNVLPLLRYGSRWQLHRKRFHQLFGTPAVTRAFHESERLAVQNFLRNVCKNPEDLIIYIKQEVGTVALDLAYGYKAKDEGDHFIYLLDRGMEQFSVATTPGAFLVDIFPPLRYLPSWLPGGGFHLQAQVWRKDLNDMVTKPYEYVMDKMINNTERHSFFSTFSSLSMASSNEHHDLKWNISPVAAPKFSTGISMIKAFFLFMSLHPEVQIQAHAEIDAVVGTERFPTHDDRANLPYINAICQEVLRLHTVVPNGLPHVVMEDDIYKGHLIPKGSIVVANIWNMLHSPDTYADPHSFNPSRFISSEGHVAERSIYDILFGFGRRICPGRVLADESLFVMVAMSLTVLEISKSVDKDGNIIEPEFRQLSGSVSQPAPFQCSIKARSPEALALLQKSHKG
ncbi:hypothetical protein H2248_004121 [Termitomyces sp. 'cryptogamus']|nr:hypothetical protein H2248_004121 [Termitomyces sp. 'cryptogamus']